MTELAELEPHEPPTVDSEVFEDAIPRELRHGAIALFVIASVAVVVAVVSIIFFAAGKAEPGTLPRDKLQEKLAGSITVLNHDRTTSVACDGSIELTEGATQRCTAETLDGTLSVTAIASVENSRYRIGFALEGFPPAEPGTVLSAR